ncbi:MAG: S9 family peptidase [Alphaproteobacteria bacterium]|jgi:oligopeptidase B|nr:S9 family peptidase [Alphaproteobacteria bacterium]MBT4711278.1 S9 family peptidase [Alphaproteobacteria bacterium]MBT5859812.1 S9 family peptidase [Alphaproteobacteria bacterium]
MPPPKAPVHPDLPKFHDHGRADEYSWLRDDNWQQVMRTPEVLKPEIREYLEAENTYAEDLFGGLNGAKAKLVEELKGRIKADDQSVPAPDGDYSYYQRFEAESQHPIFCRRNIALGSDEEVMLDVNVEAAGKSFFRVVAVEHTSDHGRLVYAQDDTGSEMHTLVVKNLATGDIIDDSISNASGDVVWAEDHETFFYTVLDENHRPSKVFRHRAGDDPENDVLVYEESDPGFFVSIGKTESRRFVVIHAHDHVTSEVHVIEAAQPTQAPRVLAVREPGVEYQISHHGDRFLLRTNADGAEDYKIVETPVDSGAKETWTDLLAHEPGRLVLNLGVFKDFFIRLERVNALPRIVVHQFSDGEEHEIAFDEEAFDLHMVPVHEFDTTTMRFAYSSLATPTEVYDYDMAARTRDLRKRQEIPSGHDPDNYVVRRLNARSYDGKFVPISVVYAKDTPLDGTAPALLYGYGAYGMSMPASFSPNRFTLVDRGFVYAIAHVRGGMEKGYQWYADGKGKKKTNTFLDFIGAAEHLVSQKFTSPKRIAAHGASAGGLLVGAVLNLRPELFGAAVAEVPFVDVLNTMLDDTLPLTPPEWPEWGNPLENKDDYRTILSYSPYDNITKMPYPHILATAGLSDPRVTYWEPAKWVARMRARKVGDGLIILKTNMGAGHGGVSGRFAKLEEIAFIYLFLLRVFNHLDPEEEPIETS